MCTIYNPKPIPKPHPNPDSKLQNTEVICRSQLQNPWPGWSLKLLPLPPFSVFQSAGNTTWSFSLPACLYLRLDGDKLLIGSAVPGSSVWSYPITEEGNKPWGKVREGLLE